MILLKNRDRKPNFKSGKYIEINDAGNYPMELSVDGGCEQETTTGKNLLDLSNLTSRVWNGITITRREDGSYSFSGTATNSTSFTLPLNLTLSPGTYTFSFETVQGFLVRLEDENNAEVFKVNDNKKNVTVTLTEEKQIKRLYFWASSGSTYNKDVFPQLEQGSTAHEYEPYTGGQPSPSPDYPQEIKTLTGNLKLTSCGKNLLPNKIETKTINGITCSNNGDGTVTLNGTATKQTYLFPTNSDYINLCLDGNYTFSATKYDNVTYSLYYDTSLKLFPTTSASKTFNATGNFKNVRPQINIAEGGTFDNTIIKFQLEKGSTAIEYEPYQGSSLNITIPENEFVGKIDDTYKDTLNVVYKDDGHYHLVLNKMIGKVVLDGSGNYNKLSGVEYNTYYIDNLINAYRTNNTMNYCSNYFISITNDQRYKDKTFFINSNNRILISYNEITTVDDFKTWLSTHNVEVYYALKTPYEVDLGIVDTLLSYDEVTNVFTDSDLYPVINVKYYKDFEFDKILRSGYNIDEQEYEIAKKQMANGKRKRILSSYDDCIIKINLGLLDNKTYQEYKEQLDDGEFHYWSYKYNQYKKANFILTKPSITTEYAYDDDIGIDDIEITLEKSSDVS